MSEAASGTVSISDINSLLLKHLGCTFTQKQLARGQLDTSGLTISHEKTLYRDVVRNSGEEDRQDRQVLFNSELSNTTQTQQVLKLKTNREAAVSYRISMQKCFTKEGNLSLSVTFPGEVLKAAIGGKRSLQLTAGHESTDSDKTRWSLDTNVAVPPGRRTIVTIRLVEEEMVGTFEVVTTIGGIAVFRPRNRHGNPHPRLSPVTMSDMRNVLTPLDKSFERVADKMAVTFKSTGRFYCRYGVRQEVMFEETDLPEWRGRVMEGQQDDKIVEG